MMSAESDPIVVENNEQKHRYEARIGRELAMLTYARSGDQIVFLHTGVPESLEGRGVASQLAHTALEDARAANLKVVAQCPYVAAYVRRHPEYFALLTPAEQERLRPR
jgi:predicted GNAT family acetyltransferase